MFKRNRNIAIIFFCFICYPLFAQNRVDIQDYWVDKFFCVSFPLNNIKINSHFGTRSDPFTGKTKMHNGLDLKANYEEVYAMFYGYVSNTGYDKNSGNYITMQYGDYTVSYCHLSKIWVQKGQRIYAGDIVGLSGSTGRSTGPHLHITSRLLGHIENPVNLLLYIRDTKFQALMALHTDEDKIQTPDQFFKRYAKAAMRQQIKYGIPASVILSQMALESKWGNSSLAQAGFNYFGIKASRDWLVSGLPYSLHNDDRRNEKFCTFPSPEASIEYHSRLLMSKRYSRCWKYLPTDYHNWLIGIKASGYATAKNYVAKCEDIIKQHKLYLYDIAAERM